MMENTQTPASPANICVVADGVLKVGDLPKVYEAFKKEIPKEGLQASAGSETGKGYDTLGYGYAWITERLNDTVGFCWRMVVDKETLEERKSERGNAMYHVSVEVVIQLGNWRNKQIEVPSQMVDGGKVMISDFKIVREFEVLAESPVGYGWHKALSKADARKGALTNGLKKAAGFLGIGNDAYKKSIDEENQQIKEALAKKRANKKPSNVVTKPVGQGNIELIKQKLAALGAKTEGEAILLLAERCKFDCDSLNNLSDKQQKMVLARLLQLKP